MSLEEEVATAIYENICPTASKTIPFEALVGVDGAEDIYRAARAILALPRPLPAEAELRRQITGYQHHLREAEQVAGIALGYPWFKDDQENFPGSTAADGVCVGEHIGETIVAELADKFTALKAEVVKAVEALEPFAEFASEYDRWQAKGSFTKPFHIRYSYGQAVADLGDFRRAAQAYAGLLALVGGEEGQGVSAARSRLPVSSNGHSEAENLWTWLSSQTDLSLQYDYPEEDEGHWTVYRLRGGVNDREWTQIAAAPSALEAVRLAGVESAIMGLLHRVSEDEPHPNTSHQQSQSLEDRDE